MDNKMLERLKKFNKNFAASKSKAEELGGFGDNPPDGKYLSRVSECSLKESNAGALHFVFQFEILESAEDESIIGTKVSKWSGIESEDGMAYLIRDLRRFGLEAESAEDLGKIADLLNKEKPEVKITLKSKDSGQFCYIDKVISEIDAGDMAADEDSEDDSEEEEAEDESEETEGGEVDIEIGTTVTFTSKKGDEVTGEVVAIDDKAGTVDIKAGTKSFKGITVDRLSVPEMEETEDSEEEEEESEDVEVEEKEEEKPSKKAAPKKVEPKKTAAKPKAKTVAKKKR